MTSWLHFSAALLSFESGLDITAKYVALNMAKYMTLELLKLNEAVTLL